METQNMTEWMEEIKRSNETQAKHAKIQTVFSCLGALFLLCMLISIISIIPKTVKALDQITSTMTELDTVAKDLDIIAKDITASDLPGMLNNVNELVLNGQTDLAEAMKKIDEIDIASLNKAIKDLNSVVSPLAKFFGKFQ